MDYEDIAQLLVACYGVFDRFILVRRKVNRLEQRIIKLETNEYHKSSTTN